MTRSAFTLLAAAALVCACDSDDNATTGTPATTGTTETTGSTGTTATAGTTATGMGQDGGLVSGDGGGTTATTASTAGSTGDSAGATTTSGTGATSGSGLASCDGTADGQSETRERYQAAVAPSSSGCMSETQTRTCNDGTWGDWSGSFTRESCMAPAGTVYTCDQHSGLGTGVCHQYASAANLSCGAGVSGSACPGSPIGYCDLGGVNANPAGYAQWHYTSASIADAAASQSICEAGGGTWTAP